MKTLAMNKYTIFVLSAFNGNLLVFAHSSTLDTSFDNFFSRSEICLWSDDAMMVVSSANKSVSDCICKGRSLINNKNKSGPKIEPCGTPSVIKRVGDDLPLNWTYSCLLSELI